jgi:hypothetical protein
VVGAEYLKYLKKERLEMLAQSQNLHKLNLSGQAILCHFRGLLGVAMGWGIYFSQKDCPTEV